MGCCQLNKSNLNHLQFADKVILCPEQAINKHDLKQTSTGKIEQKKFRLKQINQKQGKQHNIKTKQFILPDDQQDKIQKFASKYQSIDISPNQQKIRLINAKSIQIQNNKSNKQLQNRPKSLVSLFQSSL